MLILYPFLEGETGFGITCACIKCCAEKTRALGEDNVSEYAEVLRTHAPELIFPGLSLVGAGLTDECFTTEQQSLFAVVLMSEFFNRSVTQALTDLTIGGEATRN
jgi:hypothetical protein